MDAWEIFFGIIGLILGVLMLIYLNGFIRIFGGCFILIIGILLLISGARQKRRVDVRKGIND